MITVAVPSSNPKHVTSVFVVESAINCTDSVIVTEVVVKVHPLASVTVHAYVPGDNPVAICVVCPPGLHK